MANYIPSTNMNLPIPVVGVDPGPDWATNLNNSLTIIDSHNHTSGLGVQIPTAGININSDLAINSYNLTLIRSSRFAAQGSPLSSSNDLGCIYVAGADLYFNDTNGNQIRLTQSGSIVGTSGSISGLVSPASASYVSASSKFVWQSAVNTAANLDAGSLILRNITANSKGLTLNPPSSMGTDFSLTLPSLPSGQQIMTLDASGNMAAPYTVDGSTIAITSNVIGVANGGITTTQINSSAGILGSQLSASAGILGSQLSSSAGIVGTQLAAQTIPQNRLALRTQAINAPAGGFAIGQAINLSKNGGTSTAVANTTSATATISIASPAVITASAAVAVGQTVYFTTTGALPTGITANTIYYVSAIVVAGTSFNISATPGGASINTSGSQSGVHTAFMDLTSIAITTTGRPVYVGLLPVASSLSQLGLYNASGAQGTGIGNVYIAVNGVLTYEFVIEGVHNPSSYLLWPVGSIFTIDLESAGTYSYSLWLSNNTGTSNVSTVLYNTKLFAYEI